ncbi:DNA-binding protein [Nocardia nova]|uniref:DNA-binding protein n=1 Tax=Nocardia nova TaxID=37330 RepID=A0A2T2YWR2_9NOCA|nr:DNA-binding protein [Nocardia nova]
MARPIRKRTPGSQSTRRTRFGNEERGVTTEVEVIENRWYTTEEVAAMLKIDPSSLRRWRAARPPQGPPFVQVSDRVIRYHSDDVAEYLRRKRVDPMAA